MIITQNHSKARHAIIPENLVKRVSGLAPSKSSQKSIKTKVKKPEKVIVDKEEQQKIIDFYKDFELIETDKLECRKLDPQKDLEDVISPLDDIGSSTDGESPPAIFQK